MKNRGQSVMEVRRNDIRRKREMKLNKIKYMHNYGNTMFEGKNLTIARGNPKFEALKQKYYALVDEINKKIATKKKEKFIVTEDFETNLPEKKENITKMKEDINVFNNMREKDSKTREKQIDEGKNKKKKKKRDREKGRKRKITQDDMSLLNNSNSMHINFLDDFQKNQAFVEENKSSDEGRKSVKSESSGDMN